MRSARFTVCEPLNHDQNFFKKNLLITKVKKTSELMGLFRFLKTMSPQTFQNFTHNQIEVRHRKNERFRGTVNVGACRSSAGSAMANLALDLRSRWPKICHDVCAHIMWFIRCNLKCDLFFWSTVASAMILCRLRAKCTSRARLKRQLQRKKTNSEQFVPHLARHCVTICDSYGWLSICRHSK